MKRFLTAFKSLWAGLGVLLISYIFRSTAVSSFVKLHQSYFFGVFLLLFIILISGFYYQFKKIKLLSRPERDALMAKFREDQKKNNGTSKLWPLSPQRKTFLLFILIFIVCYGAIITYIAFYQTDDYSTAVNLSYLLAFAFIIAIGTSNWVYSLTRERKLRSAVQAQENLNLKLRSIRAQLNPHFMFNALTSIQNLMNKNDIAGANHYLSKFANLTRKVLNTSEQELISLEDELQILDDYLQMEQLRFGFKYEIKTDDHINIANTEIPAMLLQPFVENAVKHGVATLQQNGAVTITIGVSSNNLALSVTDNGKGFDKTAVKKSNSFGLKLSEERIALLNLLHPDQPVTLTIDAKAAGTHVTIILVNLLA